MTTDHRKAEPMPEPTRDQAVRLVAFAMTNHETNGRGCHDEPGLDCEPWCAACRVLGDVPLELIAAAGEHLATVGREQDEWAL